MRRLAGLAAALLALLAAVPALARVTLPGLFAAPITKINAAAKAPPVLLPASLPLDATHEYASGGPHGRGYDLEIGAVRHCGGADACFVAGFTATPSATVSGRRVTVRGAMRAGFFPLSCGASCSPPQIQFVVRGVRYTIQANLRRTGRSDKAVLIAAAESAITAGPR
jgi:hypothetical protein